MFIPIIIDALGTVTKRLGGCPRGVMVKVMDCGIVVSKFILQF